MRTLVIIPAFNEEGSIKELVKEIESHAYDYLVINDCSTDSTKEILTSNNLNHLDLPINLGIAGVTRVGFKYASDNDYDSVVCVDGDGQHLPEYIQPLLIEIEKGADYVVGSRFVEEAKPHSARMAGSRLLCWLIKLRTKQTVYDPTSGMRAIGKRVIKEFAKQMNYCAEPDTMCHLIRRQFVVKEVQVTMKERETGVSYFRSPFKSMWYMISVILSILFVQ